MKEPSKEDDFFNFNLNDAVKCKKENQVCVNYPGTFKCECRSGFQLDIMFQRDCKEVNECRQNGGLGDCDHVCTNTEGSFRCSCREGYSLENITQCREIDECAENNGGCTHTCHNNDGAYQCDCPPGESQYWTWVTCLSTLLRSRSYFIILTNPLNITKTAFFYLFWFFLALQLLGGVEEEIGTDLFEIDHRSIRQR